MSKATDINTYNFNNRDNLFFDTNIWFYLYGPQGNPRDQKTRIYSNAMLNAIRANSKILVDVLVISEFINRFARVEHQTLVKTGQTTLQEFKQFRNSVDFQPISQAIAAACRNILKLAQRLESNFTVVDINALLTEYESIASDFNDQILTRLCLENGLLFVTHDFDFKNKGMDILTANQRILVS